MTWVTVLKKSMAELIKTGVTQTSLVRQVSLVRSAIEKEVDEQSLAKIEQYLRNVYASAQKLSLQKYQQRKDKALKEIRKTHEEEGELTDEQQEALKHIVPVYTKDQLNREMQKLLQIKIQESVNLIKLNREQSINRTLQRFQGWATSLSPAGQLPKSMMQAKRVKVGEKAVPKTEKEIDIEAKRRKVGRNFISKYKMMPIYETKFVRKRLPSTGIPEYERRDFKSEAQKIGEPIASLHFKERRVAIDQGHKLNAAIAEVTAYSNQAVGYTWRHHFSQNPREDHEKLDDHTFPYRNSWATEQGLVKRGPDGWAEELESRPAQEINCRCTADYITTLRELWRRCPECITKKGLRVLGVA